MTITRRNVLLGATATAALAADRGPRANIRSGDRRDLSVVRRQRADRRRCAEGVRDRADIINKNYDFDLPLAKGEGCPASAAPRSAWCSPTIRPIRRRAAPKPSA
jgi:branched-chain amino acid transport system substrate-binding protein